MEDSKNYYSDTSLIKNKGLICKEKGCSQFAKARGYCKKHYTKNYRLGHFNKEIAIKMKNKICNIEGCNEDVLYRGLCSKHISRIRRYSDPDIVKIEKHNLSKTGEYSVWSNMKDRCHNPKNKSFKNYGDRGITVCKRWRDSFSAFYKDMGKRPSAKHQIDRIDNNEGYNPRNCRWVTQTENARNKRSTKMTMEKVVELRKDRVNGLSFSKLGKKYGISKRNAMDICKNKTWRV